MDWAKKMQDREAVTALGTDEDRGMEFETREVGMKLRWRVTVTA